MNQEELRFQVEETDAKDLHVQEIDDHHLKEWSEREAAHPIMRRFVSTKGYQVRHCFNKWEVIDPNGKEVKELKLVDPTINTVLSSASIAIMIYEFPPPLDRGGPTYLGPKYPRRIDDDRLIDFNTDFNTDFIIHPGNKKT